MTVNDPIVEAADPVVHNPDPDKPLSEFLNRIVTALQPEGIDYVDATIYSPKFNEMVRLRISMLSRKPRFRT